MYNPYPYDDWNAVNRPAVDDEVTDALVSGTKASADFLADVFRKRLETVKGRNCIVAFDGYISADWKRTINLIVQNLEMTKTEFEVIPFSGIYKKADVLDKELDYYVGEDKIKDPVSLFGKVYDKGFEGLLDEDKAASLQSELEHFKQGNIVKSKVVIVYGNGCAIARYRDLYDWICYFDVTPKESILRARRGSFGNIGDRLAKPVKTLIRRCYYVDFEVAVRLRGELLRDNKIDYYLASDYPDDIQLLPGVQLNNLFNKMVRYPFRCKPVYLEGVWGGTFVKRLRGLPEEMRNCAWVFDLIPMEVSLVMEVGKRLFEVPFSTFFQKEGVALMGGDCMKKFKGYFPIRFNYDDSYHSNGNMSIQVHSGKDYNVENYNELGRQDESYYVVQVGHHAKTYVGFNEEADPKEFIELAKKSEKDYTPIDYQKYIHYVDSKPGTQVLLPAGTIHSSGRNQVVLEIGSLTIGSYTYKMYDYLRADLDGNPRPIHTYHGERVLKTERTTRWVRENLVQTPRVARQGDGWAEYIVGEHDLLYFTLHRFEFEKEIEDDTNGKFHVLVLVDGEQVKVESLDHPECSYIQNYMDMVVVPANIGRYVVRNLGNQPVCIHKTMLKDGFIDDNQ
ncbi:class I mannose-6-phosphate isomerase [Parabacteroides acidifaciens]|nr:class I mannose-6-phosphate isomerase [Parabacteroides acidifaciens]